MPDFLDGESWLMFQELASAEITIVKPIHVPKFASSVSIVLCQIKYNDSVPIQKTKIDVFNSESQLPGSRQDVGTLRTRCMTMLLL